MVTTQKDKLPNVSDHKTMLNFLDQSRVQVKSIYYVCKNDIPIKL